jgi:hypothetical protein
MFECDHFYSDFLGVALAQMAVMATGVLVAYALPPQYSL